MKIKIIHKKLGRERAYGMADSDGTIYIDPRLKGKKLLEICCHELTHLLHPEFSEEQVIKDSVAFTKLLWKMGFRKVDNHDQDLLQDGSK